METRDEFMRHFYQGVDPAAYAGEGFTDTSEIANKNDVKGSPWVHARVGREEDYWPLPEHPSTSKKRR